MLPLRFVILAETISRVEVTDKQCKLGDGEGMQIPVNVVYATLERKLLIVYKVFYRNYENILPKV